MKLAQPVGALVTTHQIFCLVQARQHAKGRAEWPAHSESKDGATGRADYTTKHCNTRVHGAVCCLDSQLLLNGCKFVHVAVCCPDSQLLLNGYKF